MLGRARPFISIVLIGTAPCVCDAAPSSLPNNHQLAANVMVCHVDPTTALGPVQRGVFGTNLEWFNWADSLSDDGGNVVPGWIPLAKAQGITSVRFPGGTLSDFYHWKDGIGPEGSRPIRAHPTDPGQSPNVFGTPELLKFCAAIGATPLITVNAGTGTAAEAAGWVAYCNQSNNAQRVADGIAAPANVSLWEVGNELYLPGNPTDQQIITVTPTVYATRFLAYAAAMRAVDPTIKLIAIGTANSSNVSLPYPTWSATVLSMAAPQMDYFAVHNAYFPMTFGQTGIPVKDLFQSLWAAPEAVNDSLTALSALIAKYEGTRHIGIAVTEWGALFSADPAEIDDVKTLGSAVYLARVMQVFLGQPRVGLANYFKLTDQTFMGWVGFNQKPKIPYYVIQLFAQHFGSSLVSARIDSPTYQAKAIGSIAARSQVPELTVVASVDATGKKLYVNIVNRSWNTIHQVQLDTGAFRASASAIGWVISSPGLTDNNGVDLPSNVSASAYQEPVVSPDIRRPIAIGQTSLDVTKSIVIQPYSILTVELTAAP
ncbi:MAG TPA: alpha-L-arabinofuranosidase C-terminal domain-containing protein [Opitutaceae bacterium]